MKRSLFLFLISFLISDSIQAEKYWVFFSDKTENSFVELDEKTLERRQKIGKSYTWYDRDVDQGYIATINKFGTIHRISRWLNAVSVSLEEPVISQMLALPFVEEIKPVGTFKKKDVESDQISVKRITLPSRSLDYGYAQEQIEQINCHTAHDAGYTGQGVRVLILDTGFNTERIVFDSLTIIAEYDFINNDNDTSNETDEESSYGQHNHGTYVFSALGGYDPGNLIGPAFDSEFLLAKTEDVTSETQVEEDNYVAALEWGEQNGADVASSSLGYLDWYSYCDMDGNTGVTTIAVDIASALGVLCVTSAGNWGSGDPPDDPCDTLTYYISAPADADSVISVGAVNSEGNIAYFSSHGPTYDGRIKPEVCARGVSTWCVNPNTDSYRTASGTSLSAPLVGGAAAVILSANPDWTPMEVREAMMMTADRASDPDNDYGYGVIDVMAAIQYGSSSINNENIVKDFSLLNVFPNPFNSITTVHFNVDRTSFNVLDIFDINGQWIETISEKEYFPGHYSFIWNASKYASGIYFVRLKSENSVITKKITYIK